MILNVKNVNSMIIRSKILPDTCFCPGWRSCNIFPDAFNKNDVTLIEDKFGEDNYTMIGEEDAENFACNAISRKTLY